MQDILGIDCRLTSWIAYSRETLGMNVLQWIVLVNSSKTFWLSKRKVDGFHLNLNSWISPAGERTWLPSGWNLATSIVSICWFASVKWFELESSLVHEICCQKKRLTDVTPPESRTESYRRTGADPNYDYSPSIHWAIRMPDPEIVVSREGHFQTQTHQLSTENRFFSCTFSTQLFTHRSKAIV